VSAKAAVAEPSREEAILRGSGAILLVDDEDGIRMVAGRILKQLRYQVSLAESGRRALEIYRQEGDRIDLVILDMLMPGMGGSETFRQLQGVDPKVRVLLSSGYSLDGEAQEVIAAGALGFIQKPYRLAVLSHKVAAALRKSGTSPDAPLVSE
jgi:two-component system, cell cycle sensor histidine kinase and response regulator CckA